MSYNLKGMVWSEAKKKEKEKEKSPRMKTFQTGSLVCVPAAEQQMNTS